MLDQWPRMTDIPRTSCAQAKDLAHSAYEVVEKQVEADRQLAKQSYVREELKLSDAFPLGGAEPSYSAADLALARAQMLKLRELLGERDDVSDALLLDESGSSCGGESEDGPSERVGDEDEAREREVYLNRLHADATAGDVGPFVHRISTRRVAPGKGGKAIKRSLWLVGVMHGFGVDDIYSRSLGKIQALLERLFDVGPRGSPRRRSLRRLFLEAAPSKVTTWPARKADIVAELRRKDESGFHLLSDETLVDAYLNVSRIHAVSSNAFDPNFSLAGSSREQDAFHHGLATSIEARAFALAQENNVETEFLDAHTLDLFGEDEEEVLARQRNADGKWLPWVTEEGERRRLTRHRCRESVGLAVADLFLTRGELARGEQIGRDIQNVAYALTDGKLFQAVAESALLPENKDAMSLSVAGGGLGTSVERLSAEQTAKSPTAERRTAAGIDPSREQRLAFHRQMVADEWRKKVCNDDLEDIGCSPEPCAIKTRFQARNWLWMGSLLDFLFEERPETREEEAEEVGVAIVGFSHLAHLLQMFENVSAQLQAVDTEFRVEKNVLASRGGADRRDEERAAVLIGESDTVAAEQQSRVIDAYRGTVKDAFAFASLMQMALNSPSLKTGEV